VFGTEIEMRPLSVESNQIKSNFFVIQNTDTNKRRKTKSNVPTGHKGSKELH